MLPLIVLEGELGEDIGGVEKSGKYEGSLSVRPSSPVEWDRYINSVLEQIWGEDRGRCGELGGSHIAEVR